MNSFIVFDNGGTTADRFTLVNTETGDVFAASENPDAPNGVGNYIGNCADHRIALYGSGWRQRLPTKRMIRAEIENYVNNARLDADWLGSEVDIAALPEGVRQYMAYLNSRSGSAGHTMPPVVYLSGKRSGLIAVPGIE